MALRIVRVDRVSLPQDHVDPNPEWVYDGLSSLLVQRGGGGTVVDVVQRLSGGVYTSITSRRIAAGGAISNQSTGTGWVDFPGICQSQTFSRIAIVFVNSLSSSNVISTSAASAENGSALWRITSSGEMDLVKGQVIALGTSSGAALGVNTDCVLGVTYDGATVKFYRDGRLLSSATSTQTFTVESSGRLFAAGGGTNSFNGAIGLHADFSTALGEDDMRAITARPSILFEPEAVYTYYVASSVTPVTSDIDASYIVQSSVSADASSAFAVIAAVSADSAAVYVLRGSVSADASSAFAVIAAVSADSAAVYVLRGSVSADASASYSVRAAVVADSSAAYSVRAQASADLAPEFLVRASAQADQAASFSVRSSEQADRSAAYVVLTSAVSDVSAAYAVRGAAQADASSSYAIRAAALSDLTGLFELLTAGVAISDISAEFGVRGAAQSDLVAEFSARTSAQADRSVDYVVRAAAAGDLAGSYNVLNVSPASADIVAGWAIAGTAALGLVASYSVGDVLAQASPGYTAGGPQEPRAAYLRPPRFLERNQ